MDQGGDYVTFHFHFDFHFFEIHTNSKKDNQREYRKSESGSEKLGNETNVSFSHLKCQLLKCKADYPDIQIDNHRMLSCS